MYEPEFRLFMMTPATVFPTLGFCLVGQLYETRASVVKIVTSGLLFHVANPFATISTVPYIFDNMTTSGTEAFVAVALFRHVLLFSPRIYLRGLPKWGLSKSTGLL
jgi:hypothetical protein